MSDGAEGVSGAQLQRADESYLAPEARARRRIDKMLAAAGWAVQNYRQIALGAAHGVAVREFRMAAGHGRADYLLFIDRKAAGSIEAKPEGTTLTGVEWQSQKYTTGLPDPMEAWGSPLPFAYESTGMETTFTNALDPEPASRRVFLFHRPETLAEILDRLRDPDRSLQNATLRRRLTQMPPLDPKGLWSAQETAIRNTEMSLKTFKPRALIQMATGSGKTFTAANLSYRLIKFADARRILFLVDRANLGRQTLKEFQAFETPDDGRKFTELYNVQHLLGGSIDPVARVTISTIQRLYSILRGEELPADADEASAFEVEPSKPVEVTYNPSVPIETFDVIIVDEAHRSIYGVWRQVLEYFDAFIIGLTATPGKQTFGFFNQNLVMEYGYEQAVADNVNVDFDVYRIRTQIGEEGSTVEAGLVTRFRDRETREERYEKLDEDYDYEATQLDRSVVSQDQIRTVIKTFRDRLFIDIFPGRTEVPKTLIFAKSDAHADDIVRIVREEFGKGNDFAAKITYKSGSQGQKPEDLLASFRNSYNPRIAVTVDMIATGTDVKPLECVFFMRMVKSRSFFEQMRGRGVRVVNTTDLQGVTPDASVKDRFVLVDAVGVTETELIDVVPVERKRGVSLERLLQQVAMGTWDVDVASSVAARFAQLNAGLNERERQTLEEAAGQPLTAIAEAIFSALDADNQADAARAATGKPDPSGEEVRTAARKLMSTSLQPIADSPAFREQVVTIQQTHEQLIDESSKDVLIDSGYSKDATDRARATVESFRQFIEDSKDEITALQILYGHPYGARDLTFTEIRELADTIGLPPRRWTPERLWDAYETLEKSKVHGSTKTVLTNLVSLVRHAIGQEDELVAFPDQVAERYAAWLTQQDQAGQVFTHEQRAWLDSIASHIASSLRITTGDFEYTPFAERGGIGGAYRVFGDGLAEILDRLNKELVA
jgi:type I restriction enzyme, R subunit